MEDRIYLINLYDIYGELLTLKQQSYFEDYYFNNLNFQEIADVHNISKNAVFKQIKDVIDKLYNYEDKLKNYENNIKIKQILKEKKEDMIKRIEELL